MTLSSKPADWLSRLGKAGIDGFLMALLGAIFFAYLAPSWGAKQTSPLPLGQIASYGVSMIFFFYGLKLSPEKLKAGLSNWKLHLLVQISTFLLFPLMVLGTRPLLEATHWAPLWLGIYFLACLPSTVSSSVVMVGIGKGNVPAAIFNASISSLVGVLATPLWMSLAIGQTDGGMDLGHVMTDLLLKVILPVGVGIALHPRFGAWVQQHGNTLKRMDQSVIVLIVYTSFCDSFLDGLFDSLGATDLFLLGLAMMTLFFSVYTLIGRLSNMMGFSKPDKVTALFCGSKKSLVHGTVMAKVLFPGMQAAGLLLLPLMLYHALQLVAASALAQRLGKEQE